MAVHALRPEELQLLFTKYLSAEMKEHCHLDLAVDGFSQCGMILKGYSEALYELDKYRQKLEISEAMYDVVVKERDYERFVNFKLQNKSVENA